MTTGISQSALYVFTPAFSGTIEVISLSEPNAAPLAMLAVL
jgi:hypothetical protein